MGVWSSQGVFLEPSHKQASKPQHRCLWCGESPHIYISKPISWREGIWGNSQHVLRSDNTWGLVAFPQDSITFSVRKNPRKWPTLTPDCERRREKQKGYIYWEATTCFSYCFSITAVTKVLRGAIISIWRPWCSRRALGIHWGVEAEGGTFSIVSRALESKPGDMSSEGARPIPDHSGEFYFRSEGCSRFLHRWLWKPLKDYTTEMKEERSSLFPWKWFRWVHHVNLLDQWTKQ